MAVLPNPYDSPTVGVDVYAAALGIGKDKAWADVREGTAVVMPLRIGRALRWRTTALYELLGLPLPSPPIDREAPPAAAA